MKNKNLHFPDTTKIYVMPKGKGIGWGSVKYKEGQIVTCKAHEKIFNCRRDLAHKITTILVKYFDNRNRKSEYKRNVEKP